MSGLHRKSTREQGRVSTGAAVTDLGSYLHRRIGRVHGEAEGASPRSDDARRGGSATQSLRWHPRHNALLAALPAADFERLRPALEWVALPAGEVLCEAGGPCGDAYFPLTAIVSFTQALASGDLVEVAVAGHDGVAGCAPFPAAGVAALRAHVRGAGTAWRLRAPVLRAEFERCRPLRDALLAHAQAVVVQAAQTAACRGRHAIEQQLARFLLATLERAPASKLALTQETIGELLGVRRESVTVAAGALQAAGALRCRRGRIDVVDPQALAARACECHASVRAALARLAPGRAAGDGERRAVLAHGAAREAVL